MMPNVAPAPADDGPRRHGSGDRVKRSAARRPDKIALVFGSTVIRTARSSRASTVAANALAARGIRHGERVAASSGQRRNRLA
jgi:fatty-acyl-CoA synthase